MAREIGISSPHRRVARSRWRNTQWFELRSIWEGLLPVARLGHVDFSDTERPCWGIASQARVPLEYASASLTSAADVAVEAIGFNAFGSTGTPLDGVFVLFTPNAGYIPFLNGPLFWTAGLRPRIEFDTGRSAVITGGNPAITGLEGLYLFAPRENNTWAGLNWHYFDPPLILPATMFLTLQCQAVSYAIITTFQYREIG